MGLVDVILVLTTLLVLTGVLVVLLRRAQTRPRRLNTREVIEPKRLGAVALGEDATLLQFSTEDGADCAGVHRTLTSIAEAKEGVVHLDVDLTDRPDIAKHFNVVQTPTTLILDRHGKVQTRFGGAPMRPVIELELDRVTSV